MTTPYLFSQAQYTPIVCCENVFPQDELDQVIAFSNLDAEQAKVVGNSTFEESDTRVTNIVWLKRDENTKFIWDRVAKVLFEANQKFFNFSLTGIYEDIQLGIYEGNKGGHYDWHIDQIPVGVPRKLSLSLLLNDTSEFEGGQLQVKTVSDKPETLQIKQNNAFIFPSFYLHRVTPVTKGVRKSLVVWAAGPEFR